MESNETKLQSLVEHAGSTVYAMAILALGSEASQMQFPK